jgi:hypothetical protein
MPIGLHPGMSEWPEFDFIVGERAECPRNGGQLTGWETVKFELADEEPLSDPRPAT